MKTILLYKCTRPDGGLTVTPQEPEEYQGLGYRLIADEDKILTNGELECFCIDTNNLDEWIEKSKV